MGFQEIESCLFELHVIIGIQIVNPHHMVAHFQKLLGEMKPDKAG